MRELAELFKGLADRTRLCLINLSAEGLRRVGGIRTRFVPAQEDHRARFVQRDRVAAARCFCKVYPIKHRAPVEVQRSPPFQLPVAAGFVTLPICDF